MRFLNRNTTIGNRTRLNLGIIVFCLSFTSASHVSAKRNDMITAGLGSSMGVNHVSGVLSAGKSAFNLDFNLRVKALYVLGFEFAYSPTDQRFENEGMIFGGHLKMSGLLYFVPTQYVSAYAKGGIEGHGFSDLFDYNGQAASYHVGGGLDIELDENWVLGVEYLMLIPGVHSVERAVQHYIDDELVRFQNVQAVPTSTPTIPTAEDFLSPSNFRLALSARYFF